MTEQEYREHDCELMSDILNYQKDNAEHELQIAMNNKQLMELEERRNKLYLEFINQKPRSVNLQGEEF